MKADEHDLTIMTLVSNTNEVISYTYREYTGGVIGLSNAEAQVDRLNRTIKHWEDLGKQYKDVTLLGDINVDERKFYDNTYQRRIVELLHEYRGSSGMRQLVSEDTRKKVVGGVVRTSLIDHIYHRDYLDSSNQLEFSQSPLVTTFAPGPKKVLD